MDNIHFSSASNEWETPQDLYDWLDSQYPFTHDLACTEINKKAPVAVADSLNQDWSGLGPSLWCNPPYGRELTHWVEKAERTVRHHGDITRIVMLIPARPDTNYWHDYILNSPVLAKLSFIRGRLKFTKDGQPILR